MLSSYPGRVDTCKVNDERLSERPTDRPSEKKMFRKFLETWHTCSSDKINLEIFGVWRENFLMGLKIDFKFEILGILVQNPHR